MQDQIKERIQQLAASFKNDTIEVRRHLHRHPELSFQEYETSRYIQEKCEEYGLNFTSGWAGTGVIVEIEGQRREPMVALRADIDALPIREKNEVSYCSTNEGVMHACGHDVHTATALLAARILNEIRDELPGSVRVLFQPGEEKLPGGASLLIKEGVLKDPEPIAIFGNHVHPPLQSGKIGLRAGRYMASADELYLTIKGQGGHAALPQDTVDPITAAAQVISSLQQVVSRKANPLIPTVLTWGKINSDGGASNVVPNAVMLEGTLRTMDEDWRARAHVWIERIVKSTAEALGAVAELEIRKGYPCLDNNAELTARTFAWLREYMGDANVVELEPRMTAEDFAYYSQEIPACFYRLGTGNPSKGITSPVHTDTFDVDEDMLELSPGAMAWLSFCSLKQQ